MNYIWSYANKLESFETWLYRRMQGHKRRKQQQIVNGRCLPATDIFCFLGHIPSKDELEYIVVTGFDDGKPGRGKHIYAFQDTTETTNGVVTTSFFFFGEEDLLKSAKYCTR